MRCLLVADAIQMHTIADSLNRCGMASASDCSWLQASLSRTCFVLQQEVAVLCLSIYTNSYSGQECLQTFPNGLLLRSDAAWKHCGHDAELLFGSARPARKHCQEPAAQSACRRSNTRWWHAFVQRQGKIIDQEEFSGVFLIKACAVLLLYHAREHPHR